MPLAERNSITTHTGEVSTGLELITENWPKPLGLAEYVPMLKKRLYLKGKCSGTSLSSSPPYPSSKKNWINSSDALRKRQFHQVKDPSSRPKIANDTHLFSQATSFMPGGAYIGHLGPRGPPSDPPNRHTYLLSDPIFLIHFQRR